MHKPTLILTLFLLFCTCNCVGTQVKRQVHDNTFYSSHHPKIAIQFAPEFTYAGDRKKSDWGSDPTEGDNTTGIKRNRYFFVNKKALKHVLIQIDELTTEGWFFMPNPFADMEHIIDSGTSIINGERYQYCTLASDGPEKDGCYLTHAIGRIVSAEDNCQITIEYSQHVRDRNMCSIWTRDQPPTNASQMFVEIFQKAANKDLIFADYQPPPEDMAVKKP